MSKSTSFKQVVVKEDPKTSLYEAGIFDLGLTSGARIVALGHLFYPDHDRSMVAQVLKYIGSAKPKLVLLLGGILNEEAFKSLTDSTTNYLHCYPDQPEVGKARDARTFEKQVLTLGKACGRFIREFARAGDSKVIYIPSATHLSMPNEVRLMEFIGRKKAALDSWSANHPDASDLPSDPTVELSEELSVILDLNGEPSVDVLPYGAAVRVNRHTLFMIGDFRRRHPGDASRVEWEQRLHNIVRSFDGKVASNWMTSSDHTLPGLNQHFWEFHEVGHLWDQNRMGHLRDYDRRAPGFWTGTVIGDKLFGHSVPILRGRDGRRSFVIDGVSFTEDAPGCLPNGSQLTLDPRKSAAPPHCEMKHSDSKQDDAAVQEKRVGKATETKAPATEKKPKANKKKAPAKRSSGRKNPS